MNNHILLLLVQSLACSSIVWCCICRLTFINKETIAEIRHVVWFLGSVAVLTLGAPVFPLLDPVLFSWEPLTTPVWVFVALAAAFALMQICTSRHWNNGVPRCYIKEEFICDRRFVYDRRQ